MCWKQLLKTSATDYAPLAARVALGVVMGVHGLQKTCGLFGGPGFEGAMSFLSAFGGPVIAFLVILAESVGALAVILGFLTRFSAFSIGLVMLGAIYFVHWEKGFFAGAGGYEYHLLAIGLAVSLMISGGGALSVDGCLMKCMKKK